MSNTILLFNKILTTNKKYITRLRGKEFIELRDSGEFHIQTAYDGKHSIVTKKWKADRAVVKKPLVCKECGEAISKEVK